MPGTVRFGVMPEIPVRFGAILVEPEAFTSSVEGKTTHVSSDRKGGMVHVALLQASTREEAIEEIREALDYHGGIIYTHDRAMYGAAEKEWAVIRKWEKVFLVENVQELPYEEWAQEAEDEFWRAQAEEKECAERAEYERLREKYGDHEEA
jgi:hypothetical protein